MTEIELLQTENDALKHDNAQLREEMERINKKVQEILGRLETRIKEEARVRSLAILATMQLEAAQGVITAYETGDRLKILESKEAYLSVLNKAQAYTEVSANAQSFSPWPTKP